MRTFIFILMLSLLAACSSVPQFSADLPGREAVRNFAVEARFALKIERVGETVQNGSGRLNWDHENGSDRIFLANPLGAGLAEIEVTSARSRLRMSNGELREHANPDLLLQQVTGYALPVSRMSHWLLGRAGGDGELRRDAGGRPQMLREAGWQVEYEYADSNPAGLPSILRINRANEVMLTLRIEAWREVP